MSENKQALPLSIGRYVNTRMDVGRERDTEGGEKGRIILLVLPIIMVNGDVRPSFQ